MPLVNSNTQPKETNIGLEPDRRLRTLVNVGKDVSQTKPVCETHQLSRGEKIRRAYWDLTARLSLMINAILATLQVPVNIPLAHTGLHEPFTGLQDTLRPYYCLFDKNAQYAQGIYHCKNHDIPVSIPGVP